ncbi:MAG: nucleotidyl transferase AbiEii/AbiGii toxin family protein [Phascolarctobacterium sp.]
MHESKSNFCELISKISHETTIPEWIIEKDYYVTLILKSLAENLPFLVFKGGTSLSKCHKIINRFSEDIDLTTSSKITQGQKYKVKAQIESTIHKLGMYLANGDAILSKRNYNRYIIQYDTAIKNLVHGSSAEIIVETVYKTTAFPTTELRVTSIIGDYLNSIDAAIIEQYHLEDFTMQVQNVERTLVDKVFAICDYYLSDKSMRNSRHIYDIYKLLTIVSLDDSFRNLVVAVRNERMKSPVCYSAKNDVDPQIILQKIVKEKAFESDYKAVTEKILLEKVSYEEALQALKKVIDSKMFVFSKV